MAHGAQREGDEGGPLVAQESEIWGKEQGEHFRRHRRLPRRGDLQGIRVRKGKRRKAYQKHGRLRAQHETLVTRVGIVHKVAP